MRRLGVSMAERQRAERARQVWSWDFVEDQTENGSRFRMTLIDEYIRQSLAVHAAWSICALDVTAVLEVAIARYGAPEHLRSDNGPEFIAYAIQDWLAEARIKTLYLRPGSPWENGHIESYHDKLRDECLNRELFGSLAEARIIQEAWRVDTTSVMERAVRLLACSVLGMQCTTDTAFLRFKRHTDCLHCP